MLRHSPATGKIGSKQSQRPIQKHAGRSSIDRNTAPHLSDPRYLLKCDALSCEEIVKTVQTCPRRKESFAQWETSFPSMLWYGTRSLFRTNFPRCHALLSFLTSSLASPMVSSNIYLIQSTQVNRLSNSFSGHIRLMIALIAGNFRLRKLGTSRMLVISFELFFLLYKIDAWWLDSWTQNHLQVQGKRIYEINPPGLDRADNNNKKNSWKNMLNLL